MIICPNPYNVEEGIHGCGSSNVSPIIDEPGFFECNDCGLYFALPEAVESDEDAA